MSARLPGLVLVGVLSLTGAGALAQAEAERRLDAAIERLRGALGPDMRLEIGRRQVDPVTGRAVLSDVVLSDAENRLTVPEVHLSDVSETRIGRAELLRSAYRGPNGGTGEVGRILVAGMPVQGKALDIANLAFEAVEVEGARLDDPTRGAMRLGRLEVRDWRPDGIGTGALEGFEFRATGDAQVARLGRVALEQVTLPMAGQDFDPVAFRAARIAVEGAELREQAQGVAVVLGRFSLQDWMPGRPVALAVEGLQVASPAGSAGAVEVSLGKLEASGVDAPRTLEAVMTGVQVPDPFPGTPQRVLLEGLDGAWEGQPVVSLARLLTEGGLENGVARGGMLAEGLRIMPPRGKADWLEALGYSEIAGGLEMRGSAPRAGGRLEVAPFRLAWEQAATLTVAAQVDGMPGVPAEGTAVDPDATAMQLAAAQLAGLTLSLRDHGLLGRVLAQQARAQRVPEARLREQWAQMALAMPLPGEAQPQRGPARRGAAAPPAGPPAKGKGGAPEAGQAASGPDPIPPMREALAAFIRQPGTLEITLRPPRPIPFAELNALSGSGAAEAVQRLGLTIVAR